MKIDKVIDDAATVDKKKAEETSENRSSNEQTASILEPVEEEKEKEEKEKEKEEEKEKEQEQEQSDEEQQEEEEDEEEEDSGK